MNFQETKNYIIQKLKENKDEFYENYEWDEIEGVNDFLMEFTNQEHSLEEYFYGFEFNNDIIFECINYINECYNDLCGEDIPINMINSEDKIKNQMIYWVGEEIKEELLEDESDSIGQEMNEYFSEEGEEEEEEDIIKDYEKMTPDYVIVPEVA